MKRYIVVGGGIAGMMTAWTLHQRNALHKIYISPQHKTASLIAAGVINPITGIRFAKTWMADEIFPFTFETYRFIEQQLNVSFFQLTKIFRIAETVTQLNDWSARSESDSFQPYISDDNDISPFIGKVRMGQGGFFIAGAAKINVTALMGALAKYFEIQGMLVSEKFDTDSDQSGVIFCEGIEILKSNSFQKNPIVPVKGHYLVCAIPELKTNFIIHGKATIIPQPDGNFRVGSTYQRGDISAMPDDTQIALLEEWLKETIQTPYEVKDVLVGIRPSSVDRRPILGALDKEKNIYVFNGLGTKGYSLAPYFANHLCRHILDSESVMDEVNVNRFSYS